MNWIRKPSTKKTLRGPVPSGQGPIPLSHGTKRAAKRNHNYSSNNNHHHDIPKQKRALAADEDDSEVILDLVAVGLGRPKAAFRRRDARSISSESLNYNERNEASMPSSATSGIHHVIMKSRNGGSQNNRDWFNFLSESKSLHNSSYRTPKPPCVSYPKPIPARVPAEHSPPAMSYLSPKPTSARVPAVPSPSATPYVSPKPTLARVPAEDSPPVISYPSPKATTSARVPAVASPKKYSAPSSSISPKPSSGSRNTATEEATATTLVPNHIILHILNDLRAIKDHIFEVGTKKRHPSSRATSI